jgi:hypothetical protein
MIKFLEFPITATGETSQLVCINGVILVEQASTTTVTLTYGSGSASADVVTITLAVAMAANDVSVRDRIQYSIIEALQSPWTKVKKTVSVADLVDGAGVQVAITGIAIA